MDQLLALWAKSTGPSQQVVFLSFLLYWHNQSVDVTPWQIPAFDPYKASAKFEVVMSNSLGGDEFTIGMKFYFLVFIDV